MNYIGLNKKLYDRRLELDYSVKEASIRLDISKTKLYLIENGYIKVHNPELQARFIKKYKLSEDFFTNDKLGYPTPLEAEPKPKRETKFSKVVTGKKFKIGCFVLMCGFIAMSICGLSLSPRLSNDTASFFSSNFNHVKEVARSKEHGTHHKAEESYSGSLCLSDFDSFEREVTIPDITTFVGFWYSAVNFVENDENLPFTFYAGMSCVDLNILGLTDFPVACTYEARYLDGKVRLQFNSYVFDEEEGWFNFDYPIAHISADYDNNKDEFVYNLVEVIDLFSVTGSLIPVSSTSLEYAIFSSVMENEYGSFYKSLKGLFLDNSEILGTTFETFDADLRLGIADYNKYSSKVQGLTMWGLILSVLFLAFLAFSFIKTGINKVKTKVFVNGSETDDEIEIENCEISKNSAVLKKNLAIQPIIPEMVIRILVLLVSIASSLGIFYIFQAVQGGDIPSLLENISFKAEIASSATLAMMLLFFTKLDIQQSKKNTFLVNYILFFLGLIFYAILMIIQFSLSNSTTTLAQTSKQLLPYLPGNIVWGILAFNLLSSILFSTPKFKGNQKKKMIIYRSMIIFPLAYMLISSLYQIGNKAWGWNWPFAVTSLLFSKALILTVFSILYCVIIFIYKRHVKAKYGENYLIYQAGNKYMFTKNLLVCGIVLILGILDIVLVNVLGPDNVIGAGGYYVILFAIPFILLYHPHLGKRNKTWDLLFAGLYAFSMVLGLVLIGSNLSVYITSL
ncbi:MAG: hypothetical protein MJ225_02935 [Bacilli bacterium]|nr:hypothetical protein [Bacilli bacterium]